MVSKCMDTRTKKTVAIKKVIYEPNHGGTNRELVMLKELRHPNCISVISSFTSEEFLLGDQQKSDGPKKYLNIVMDYIPDNLYKIIRHYAKTNMAFPDTLARVYSYQLFRCLHYLRSRRIMHRDIKPDNLLVDTRNHQLYFCDFGSAKRVVDGENNTTYICSRYYRAPELLYNTECYDMTTDMWSVGCVLGEMYLQVPLFMGSSTKDQIEKIAEVLGVPDDLELKSMKVKRADPYTGPKPLTLKNKLAGKAPPLVIDLVSKILVYDPKKRLTPVEAMLHPYFDPLREKKITINKQAITDLFNFLPEELEGHERAMHKLTPSWYYKQSG